VKIPINYRTTLKFCIVSVNFERRKEKRGGKESVASDKLCQHLPHAPPKKQRQSSACNDMSKGGFWLLDGATHRAQRAQMPPTHANHFFLYFFILCKYQIAPQST